MYYIPGVDDEEQFAHLLGRTPLDDQPDEFQAQQSVLPPDIATGLTDGNVAQQLNDMASGATASEMANLLSQVGQSYNNATIGQSRRNQMAQANQAAMQQSQQSGRDDWLGLLGLGLGLVAKKFLKGGSDSDAG